MATITEEVEIEITDEHVSEYLSELDSEDALRLAQECLGQMHNQHTRELAAEIIKEEGEEKSGRNCMASELVEELAEDKLVALIKEILDQVDLDTSTCIFEHAMARVQELKNEEADDDKLCEDLKKQDFKATADDANEGYIL